MGWFVQILPAALIVAGLTAGWRQVRGSTLVGPWCWAFACAAAITGVEIAVAGGALDADLTPHVRFWAACSSFCPIVSLLGAKRPQDRPWQFIVAGLWLVLVLPSMAALVLRPSAELTLHGAQQFFLIVLWLAGAINLLPTCYAMLAILQAIGQYLLFDGFLLGPVPPWTPENRINLAMWLGAMAVASWGIGNRRRKGAGRASVVGATPEQVAWSQFRNSYGLLWSLRAIDLFNAAAERAGWKTRLKMDGFEVSGDQFEGDGKSKQSAGASLVAADELRPVRQALANLLGRFLPPERVKLLLSSTETEEPEDLASPPPVE